MKTRRTIKGTSAEGVVEEAYTLSNPPPYPVVTDGSYPNMTVGKATNATNIIPDSNGAVNPDGRGSGMVGNGSVAIGSGAVAPDGGTIAIGKNAEVLYQGTNILGGIAIGQDASSDYSGISIGASSSVNGTSTIGIGTYSNASQTGAIAIGSTVLSSTPTTASGECAIALGQGATASGERAIALGQGATASGRFSTAIGWQDTASATGATALGGVARGSHSTVIGGGGTASTSESDADTMQLGGASLSVLRSKVNLTVTSDKRDKADISEITSALEFINKLNPVTFVSNDRVNYISESDKESENYRKYGMCDYDRIAHAAGTKKGERRRCGLLAQEVIAAMQVVYGTDNYANIVNDNFHDLTEKPSDVENKYTLAYANLVPFLIGAIKELNAKIKSLEDKLK